MLSCPHVALAFVAVVCILLMVTGLPAMLLGVLVRGRMRLHPEILWVTVVGAALMTASVSLFVGAPYVVGVVCEVCP